MNPRARRVKIKRVVYRRIVWRLFPGMPLLGKQRLSGVVPGIIELMIAEDFWPFLKISGMNMRGGQP
jgi:hypothetical protein